MSNISLSSPASLLVALVIVGAVLFRQMQKAPLSGRRLLILPALFAFGALQLTPALLGIDALATALAGAGLLAGVALGAARGLTVRIWTGPDGRPWTQGTWATVALWGALIAFRIAIGVVDHSAGVAVRTMYAEMTWMLFATFSAQNAVTWLRAGGLQAMVAAAE